ncbi:MAG: hypothetical protein OCD01_04860 [Fibrobacterales bacterium]
MIFSTFDIAAFMPYTDLFFDRIEQYGVDAPTSSKALLSDEIAIQQLCDTIPYKALALENEVFLMQ